MFRNLKLALILSATGLMSFTSIPSFAKGAQCSPRFIAQNIQTAVLALKATQYCKGVELPYSAAQASKRVDSLRCGDDASGLLDDLINDHDGKYKSIMSGTSKQVICNKAALLKADLSNN